MTPTEEAFFKKRRNLSATALLVAFINVAGGELRKLNLFGNEIEFTNPNAIPAALGIALTYFVIRYLQYAHDVEDKGFKKRFYGRVERYLAPYVMKREFKRPNSVLSRCYKDLSEIQVEDFIMFDRAMPRNTAAASFVGKEGGQLVDENELTVSNWELLLPFVRAAVYIVFRTRLATDYVLPIIIAISAYGTYFGVVKEAVATWL
jgi:hypothetical protein